MGHFDFDKEKNYLICMDSDGCVVNSMEEKHRKCFGPIWIETYGLEDCYDQCINLWLDLNLYSLTRGINRFKGLAMVLQECLNRESVRNGFEVFEDWVQNTTELSNASLVRFLEKNESACGEKALMWSIRVNRSIQKMTKRAGLFENVKETMEQLCTEADLVAVSSANTLALEEEWKTYGIEKMCKSLLSQEDGSKKECIRRLLEKGYTNENVVMVGDAIGDMEAALHNKVSFFPILVGSESQCWKEFGEEGLQRLKNGTFQGEYQNELIKKFKLSLTKRRDCE